MSLFSFPPPSLLPSPPLLPPFSHKALRPLQEAQEASGGPELWPSPSSGVTAFVTSDMLLIHYMNVLTPNKHKHPPGLHVGCVCMIQSFPFSPTEDFLFCVRF